MDAKDNISIIKSIEMLEAVVSLRSDRIIHVHFKKNTIFDRHLLIELRTVYSQICEGKKSKFLFTSEEGFTLTKEAREFAKRSPDPNIVAYALVANNMAYRIIANFVINVNKPPVPYRLFGTPEEGVKWLKTLA